MKRLLIILLFIVAPRISPSSLFYKDIQHVDTKICNALSASVITMVGEETSGINIPDSIFEKQLLVESGGKHTVTRNGETRIIRNKQSGAVGIAQFLPSTWKWLKQKELLPEDFSIENEYHQRVAHRIYMYRLAKLDYEIDGERMALALASYNAGYGRISTAVRKYGKDWKNHIPKQTKTYLKIILC